MSYYCGHCKSDPCRCDGHGNFADEPFVGWSEVHPLEQEKPMEEYESLKKAADAFNASQTEEQMIVGRPLVGEEAVSFLEWLMSMSKRVRDGEISGEQLVQNAAKWVVPEDDNG